MKKTLLITALISLGIVFGGTLINYLYYQSRGYLLFAWRMWGGEITHEMGFGWNYVHIYAMTPGESDTRRLTFSIPQFLLCFAAVFLIVFVIVFFVTKLTAKKKAAA